jgi:hypothetical protein
MSEEDATLSCERMRDAVARRRLHRFAVIAAIAVAAGVLVGAASATHETSGWITHYTGSLTSLEGRNYGPLDCNYVNWSEMSWQTGNGGYGMARIIQNSNGAVIISQEGQGGMVGVGSPLHSDYTSWKANCRNSTPWQVTHYGVVCRYRVTYDHFSCV